MLVQIASDLKWVVIVVMGGFALVNNNKVTVLVNEAEFGSVFFGSVKFYLLFLSYLFRDLGYNIMLFYKLDLCKRI